jgi:hypothetical protein
MAREMRSFMACDGLPDQRMARPVASMRFSSVAKRSAAAPPPPGPRPDGPAPPLNFLS